jgi:hypothetical protein
LNSKGNKEEEEEEEEEEDILLFIKTYFKTEFILFFKNG